MKTLITAIFIIVSLSCFSQENTTYEYLAMTQSDNEIRINKDSTSLKIIIVKDEKSKDTYDFRPLLTRIQKYEQQGWEIFSNNVFINHNTSAPQNYVLMRRKK